MIINSMLNRMLMNATRHSNLNEFGGDSSDASWLFPVSVTVNVIILCLAITFMVFLEEIDVFMTPLSLLIFLGLRSYCALLRFAVGALEERLYTMVLDTVVSISSWMDWYFEVLMNFDLWLECESR